MMLKFPAMIVIFICFINFKCFFKNMFLFIYLICLHKV